MELHVKTVPQVVFNYPTSNTSVTGATYSLNGATPVALTVTNTTGKATATLPYLQSEGDLTVNWSFTIPSVGSYTDQTFYDIVTPLLTLAEVKAIYPQATDPEAAEVEAAVRHIINAHTGQTFGYSTETISVEGHGESALRMPKRLITLTGFSTVNAVLDPNSAIIVSDGWYIKKGWSQELSAIETDSLYWTGEYVNNEADPGEPGYEKPGHGYVIVAPGSGGRPTSWRDDYPFIITGTWGYLTIPEAVRQAAKLLVNDYACKENTFRDRYLESIKAADWRLQFSSRAWEYTGNVRADQLLSEFVLADWAVI